jgi:hypothetical protein
MSDDRGTETGQWLETSMAALGPCTPRSLLRHARPLSKIGDAYASWVVRSEKRLAANREKLVADFNDHSARFKEIGQSIRLEGMETGFPAELIPRAGRFAVPTASPVIDLTSPEPRDFAPSGIFKDRVTLLGVSSSAHGREFVSKIVEPLVAEGGVDDGSRQVVELSLIDNGPLTWLVKPILLPSIRSAIPPERRRHFLCLFGDSLDVRRALKIQNRFAGYVYIVDRRAHVAWHAAGHRKTDVGERDVDLVRILLAQAAGNGR